MPASKQAARHLQTCLRCTPQAAPSRLSGLAQIRSFTSTPSVSEEVQAQKPAAASSSGATAGKTLDPNTVFTRREERKLIESGVRPIGSRRRRAVLAASPSIPFEQLPYQCFQEARKVLAADRQEKIAAIEAQRARIARVEAQDAAVSGGEEQKKLRLISMRNHVEELKILADINDPVVKKKFEDGQGDMNKPIYRYLADRKWREYRRKVVEQRITQMNVIPDILPGIDPVADVSLAFGRRKVQPGDKVNSAVSEIPLTLNVQVFDKSERLVTVVVVDPDVPNVEKNGFDYRCHYIAANIPISPTQGQIRLGELSEGSQVVLPWLPPFAQKGSPYHRLSVFVLQQQEGKTLDVSAIKGAVKRDGFILRSFIDKHALKPVGVNLFRTEWDETMDGVMRRNGIEGVDIEFAREKSLKLPYKKKDGARYR